jgi:TRAP-type C4-dicarboxylate transport system permease small subunit
MLMNRFFEILEEWIPAALLLLMTVIVLIDVSGRYVLNFTVPGATEVAMVLFVWLIFLGSAGAIRKFKHIGIDTLVMMLPLKLRPALLLITSTLLLALSLYMLKLSWSLVLASGSRVMEMMQLPYTYIYAVMPISSALISWHLGAHIVDLLRHWSTAEGLEASHEMEA